MTGGGHPLQCAFASAQEVVFQQQVLRRIAGQNEFRKRDQLCSQPARIPHGVDDSGGIAVQIADGRIDLGQDQAHAGSGFPQDGQDLLGLLHKQVGVASCLEVHAQHRLGVRPAHVDPPTGEL